MEVNGNIVLWCGDAPNHRALANKVHLQFGLAGIVVDQKTGQQKKKKSTSFLKKLVSYVRFRPVYKAWTGMQQFYQQRYPEWPQVPILKTSSINNTEAYTFTKDLAPALIVVTGTSLVKEPLLSVPSRIGIINLHTGLSPYVKGGPNCTNWCIANNDWHLIGNTIMWINAGIDTGNIITTETTDIRGTRSLLEAHIQVMEHAHDLYLRSIGYLLRSAPPFQSVPQNEITMGSLYLTKMWGEVQQKQLLENWRRRRKAELKSRPVTIDLPK